MSCTRQFCALAVGAVAVVMLAASASAQPGRGGFGGGGITGLLRDSAVAKELELVDDQVEQIQKIGQDIGQKMRDKFGELRNLGDDERRDAFRTLFADIQKETEDELGKVLLPHQMKRLQQIQRQSTMRGRSSGGIPDSLAEELKITDEQKEKMTKVAEEAQEDLQDAIRKAQEDAREKVLAVLTPSQRAQYKELLGEPFEFSRQGFGGGQPGGNGGRQGGRQGGGRPGGNNGGRPPGNGELE